MKYLYQPKVYVIGELAILGINVAIKNLSVNECILWPTGCYKNMLKQGVDIIRFSVLNVTAKFLQKLL